MLTTTIQFTNNPPHTQPTTTAARRRQQTLPKHTGIERKPDNVSAPPTLATPQRAPPPKEQKQTHKQGSLERR